MVHLDGRLVADLRGDLSDATIESRANHIAADLMLIVPPRVRYAASICAVCMCKAEREGDTTVEDLPGRLIAEVLDVTPANLGRNPPETPFSWGESQDKLRERQRKRLLAMIRERETAHQRRKAHAEFERGRRVAERRAGSE